jgi:hypothetical protein
MKQWLAFLLCFSASVQAQSGFRFTEPNRRQVRIPFTLINNLIVLPVVVNGARLNFLLDTGVDETILFSLEEHDEVQLNNVEKIKLKGLGENEPVEGLKSSGNTVSFPGFEDRDHDIYIVLDQSFNFSSSIGIPVNGILGYQFFRDYPVRIDYDRRRITVFHDRKRAMKKVARGYQPVDIVVDERKPYIVGKSNIGGKICAGKMLIDTGNTDAVWLFPERIPGLALPSRSFEDFLGRGLSGDINGRRGKAQGFDLAGFAFPDVLIAFPDSTATQGISLAEGRIGSVGGEILQRFSVMFDYSQDKMFLRRGARYADPFNYNMSGMEVQHMGMNWLSQEVAEAPEKKTGAYKEIDVFDSRKYSYEFVLQPIFSISNIRPGSPADSCGLQKGDILVSLNRRPCGRMTLQQIKEILKSEEGREIEVEVARGGKTFKCKFRLKNIL